MNKKDLTKEKLVCGCKSEDCLCPVTDKEYTELQEFVDKKRFDAVMSFIRNFEQQIRKDQREKDEKENEQFLQLANASNRKLLRIGC